MTSFTGQSSSVSLSVIPIFEGEIYKFWKVKMETLLMSEGLWNIVDKGFNKPADENQLSEAEKEKLEVNRMMYAKALSKLQNGVSSTVFPRIIRATTAKQAWEGKSAARVSR